MMFLWDAFRMNKMISYQELVRTFPNIKSLFTQNFATHKKITAGNHNERE